MKLSQKPIFTDPTLPGGSYVPISVPTPFGSRIFRVPPNIVGAVGPQGVQGPIGPTGAAGAAGPAGANGTNGINGTNGTDGSVWHHGAGAPGVGVGVDGDYYFDDSNGDIYQKVAGAWGAAIANVTGPAGAAWAPAHSTLAYAASVTVDFTGDDYKTVTLTGDIDFTDSSNRAAGRSVVVRVVCDGSIRNVTFNANWKFFGTEPATLAANKEGCLSLTAFGANETDVRAVWVAEE